MFKISESLSFTAHFVVINNRKEIRAGGRSRVTIPGAFPRKKVIFWMAKSGSTYKMAISNYSGTITTSDPMYSYSSNKASLSFNTEKLFRIMVANKFYDLDNREYHMTLIEEKKRGTYMIRTINNYSLKSR